MVNNPMLYAAIMKLACSTSGFLTISSVSVIVNVMCLKVRPHRMWAAAVGSGLCPRRADFRTVLHMISSSLSNRRRAAAADQSRSRRAAGSCVLQTDLPGGQHSMAEELTEKLIEKVREYVFLYDPGHPQYKNVVKKAEAWRDISE